MFDTGGKSPLQDASGPVNARAREGRLWNRNEPCGELTVNPKGGGFTTWMKRPPPAGASQAGPSSSIC